MKSYGIALSIAGFLLVVVAFAMGSTVPQEVPYSIDLPTLTRTQEMHNLPRAQTQLLVFIGGCTCFLGGLLLLAAGAIEQAIGARMIVDFVEPAAVRAASAEEAEPVAAALSVEEIERRREEAAVAAAERQALIEQGNRGERQATILAFVAIGITIVLVLYSQFR